MNGESIRPALSTSHASGLATVGGLAISLGAGILVGVGQQRFVLLGAFLLAGILIATFLGRLLIASPGKLGCWLLAIAFFTMPLNAFRVTESVTLGDFFLLAALPFAVASAFANDRIPRLPRWLVLGGLLLVASILLVELFPPDGIQRVMLTPTTLLQEKSDVEGTSNLLSGLRLVVAFLLLPVITCLLATSWSRIRLLTNAWVGGVAISCLVAVLGATTGVDPLGSLEGSRLVGEGLYEGARSVGFSVHPVTLSLTAVMAAPVVLTRITDLKSGMTYGPLFAIFIVAILLSGTRAGLLALIAVSVIALLIDRRTRRTLAVVMLGVAACLCVLLLTTSVPGTERFQGDDVSVGDSNRSRLTLYEESVEYIGERPIVGNGFDLVRGSHNLTLQLLLAGGLIALVGYLTVFFGYLSIGWKLRPRVPDWLSGDSVGLTLSLVAFLLAGVFSNDVYARYLYIPAGLLLSMSLVYEREAGKRPPRSEVG